MKAPFFSLVIPTLNEERFLPRLLSSLRKQTEFDFEVIVVDGLSVDKTGEIVQEFHAPFSLRLIHHKANNVGEQRNHGAKSAKGEFLIFFDADVFVAPHFLEQVKKDINNEHIDFASPKIKLDSNHWYDRILEWFINMFMIGLTALKKPLMTGQAFIMRRNAFLKIGGFDPTIVHAEDGELAQRAAKFGLKGKILTDLTLLVSARRFDQEKRLPVLLKYLQANIYMVLKGPIRKDLFQYKMGGGHHG